MRKGMFDDFLEEIKVLYEDHSIKEISLILRLDYQKLRDYTVRKGLRKFKHINWTPEIECFMQNTYVKYGAKPTSKKYKIPVTAVNKKALELNLRYEGAVLGGYFINKEGYKVITIIKKGKRICLLEHRKVMSDYVGRPLTSEEIVHHINGDKKDNRISNLTLVSRKEHINMHRGDLK